MGLLERKYHIIGWKSGEEYLMTARQFYERIMQDSQLNYGWITHASEIVRICQEKSFPKEYAQKIKIAIVNCFANKQIDGNIRLPTDEEAVNFCYNSLADTSQEADKARQRYLRAVIEAIAKYHFRIVDFNHAGPTYTKLCEEWKNERFAEYSKMPFLDFKKLRTVLDEDFEKTMKEKERQGAFKQDDAKRMEAMQRLWDSLSAADMP